MFLETICIENGKVKNLQAHQARMQQSAAHHHFTAPALPDPTSLLPPELKKGKVRCSLIYHTSIEEMVFVPYHPKQITTLQLLEASPIYGYKYADRTALNHLQKQKGYCDEVLITRNGLITDTSYSNVVLRKEGELFTPDTFLLNGTKRQQLLREGVINEREIRAASLGEYDRIYLINAMLDIEDNVSIPVNNIYP